MKESVVKLYIDGVLKSTHPIYSDKINVAYERENNEMYYRTKLDSTFTFVRDDFDAIYQSGIDTDFEIEVYDDAILVARATFEKTDCNFDVENKICEVKVSGVDQYQKILNAINNEYDLVQLAPERETIHLTKRAIIQLYVKGDNKITNLVGNTSYEINANSNVVVGGESKPVEELTPSEIEDFHFAPLKYILSVDVKPIDAVATAYPLLGGVYSGERNGNVITIKNENNYSIEINKTAYYPQRAYILDAQGNRLSYDGGDLFFGFSWQSGDFPASFSDSINYVDPAYPGYVYNAGEALPSENAFFARLLFDRIPSGQSYDRVPENDICENNLNYRYVAALNVAGMPTRVKVSNEVQDEPTKWGVNGDGKYFVKPQEPPFIVEPLSLYIPIGWNVWIPSSFWFLSSSNLNSAIQAYDAPFDLRDAYPLWSAIGVLLENIDKDVKFEGTSTYSQFLYGNIITMDSYVKQLLYISPITNVKKTYYNQAARKGKITLGQIFDMLKNTAQLYWFIDDGKLRIEHISWFKNGGSYAQASPLEDLTTIGSPMSMKAWDYGTNIISYDKGKINKRYEFGWNDDCTDAFDGFALNVQNEYARNGKTYKASIGNFISDIDLVVSAPDRVSDDCFALIGVSPETKICPIAGIGSLGHYINIPTYIMQNAYLSFLFLELAYWKYDLGGDFVMMEDTKTSYGTEGFLNVVDIQRIKKQSVKFPMASSEVGKQGLIHTSLGNGEWGKATYTIEDGMVAMDLYLTPLDNAVYSIGNFTAKGVTMEKDGDTIVLKGNRINYAYGYFRIKANKNIRVTMVASSEDTDYGWKNDVPLITSDYVERFADKRVSGLESITFNISQGVATFIGYSKDMSVDEEKDTITITIEEI